MHRVIHKVRGQKISYNIKSINLITKKLFLNQSQQKPPNLLRRSAEINVWAIKFERYEAR